MPTYIDGIGASENIDSSGERIIIAGLDISSLDKDGVFNYEHKSDQPSQVVGKVLKAKKIFSDKDCDDDRQLYFWQKVQTPYLYVMGELFDDFKESSKDVAGMFRYDAAKKGQNERNVMNFSVEGAKIAKEGMDIVRSIARKITITVLPCNKMAIAEMVPTSKKKKDDLDGIFKTESAVEVELLKFDGNMTLWETLKKADPNKHAEKLGINAMKKDIGGGLSTGASSALAGGAPSSPALMASERKLSLVKPTGHKIGTTKSGKDVHSHGRVGEYGFNAEEHAEAAEMHNKAAKAAKDPRWGRHHSDKAKLHHGASQTAKDAKARTTVSDKDIASKNKPAVASASPKAGKLHDPQLSGKIDYKKSEMAKALDAGSMNVAPGALSGGAALGKESFSKKPVHPTIKSPNINRKDTGFGSITHKPGGSSPKGFGKVTVKSELLKRAEQEYENWAKREEFETFMAKRLPHLSKGEVKAIGQTLVLSKSLKAEKNLSKMAAAQNYQHSYVAKKEK